MIEGGAPGPGLGVDENEVVAAFNCLAVPEPAGLADPGGAFGDIDNQTLEAIAKAVRPPVVGERALGAAGRGVQIELRIRNRMKRWGRQRPGMVRTPVCIGAAMSGLELTRDVMYTLQFVNCSILFLAKASLCIAPWENSSAVPLSFTPCQADRRPQVDSLS